MARNETKKVVSKVRVRVFDRFYQSLALKKRKEVFTDYKNIGERKTRALDQVQRIKNEEGKVLVIEQDIKERGKSYFHKLFNEGHRALL